MESLPTPDPNFLVKFLESYIKEKEHNLRTEVPRYKIMKLTIKKW